MVRLLSAIRETIQFKMPAVRKPLQVGNYETVFPAPTRSMSFGQVLECSPEAAAVILERKGPQGVIPIGHKVLGDGQFPNETDEAALYRAKRMRLTFLNKCVNNFRNHNAWLRAQNIPVLLPNERLRDRMHELQDLSKEIDGALMGTGDATGPLDMVTDVAAKELEQFGLPSGSAPLVPGVESGLSGIDAL